MYDSLFCRIYNEFGWNEYPRTFGETLLLWLGQNRIGVRTALDLGCGTGVLCETLHAQGIDTLGIDLSEDMIALAQSRAPQLDYRVGDMTAFDAGRTFDLVTCTGDALNHVTDLDDLKKVFGNVHRTLNPGGLFVFDLLRGEEVPLGEPFEAPFSDGLTVRFCAEQSADGFTTLRIEGLLDGIVRFRERIRERLYDIDAIRAMLRAAGFDILQCADRLLPENDAHGTTWFVIAEKPADQTVRPTAKGNDTAAGKEQ